MSSVRSLSQKNIKSAFDAILARCITSNDDEGMQDFLWENRGYLSEEITDSSKNTFLHSLATLNPAFSLLPAALRTARFIIKLYPKTMTTTNNKGEVPLRAAIEQPNLEWVEQILTDWNSYIRKDVLQQAIAALKGGQGGKGNTLHAILDQPRQAGEAISAGFYQVLNTLIDNATDVCFTERNDKNYTPLHLAVDPGLCTQEQVKVVEKLLKLYDGASPLDLADSTWESPYLVHNAKLKLLRKSTGNVPLVQQAAAPQGYKSEFQPKPVVQARQDIFTSSGREGTSRKLSHRHQGSFTMQSGVSERPIRDVDVMSTAQKLIQMPRSHTPSTVQASPTESERPTRTNTPANTSQPRSQRLKPNPAPLPTDNKAKEQKKNQKEERREEQREEQNEKQTGEEKEEQKEEEKEEQKEEPESFAVLPEYVKKVYEMLRRHYLWTKTSAEAQRILYGDKPEDEFLTFLIEQQEKFSFDLFQMRFGALRPASWMHSVILPNIEVDREKPPGVVRNDALFFFDWLRRRNVEKIFHVFVDDYGKDQRGNDDDVISKSLEGFEVMELDWKKVDLCPVIINAIGANLRRLHLYWSGSNAVLCGWCAPDALSNLKKLEEMRLSLLPESLKLTNRDLTNLDKFEKRLQRELGDGLRISRDWSTIEVAPAATRVITGTQGMEDNREPHRWLRCMDDFRREFGDLTLPKLLNPVLYEKLDHRITIALIDDGLDLMGDLELGTDPSVGGCSLYYYVNDEVNLATAATTGGSEMSTPSTAQISAAHQAPRQGFHVPSRDVHWISDAGHGTAMAYFIFRVFPQAKLLVYRLKSHISRNAKSELCVKFDPKSAIQAIGFAARHKADIINMSWSIPSGEMDDSTREAMKQAIELAASQNILIFCAADDAKRDEVVSQSNVATSYPGLLRDKVTIIGAADTSGTVWARTQRPYDFVLPGCKVRERHWDSRAGGKTGKQPALSGSSISTALASGLAGLLLHCVRASAIYVANKNQLGGTHNTAESALDINDFHKLHQRAKMWDAFNHIGAKSETDARFIAVWDKFDQATKNMKSYKYLEEKWDAVFEVVRDIVNKTDGPTMR